MLVSFFIGLLFLYVGFLSSFKQRWPWIIRFLVIFTGVGCIVYFLFLVFQTVFPV